MNTPKYVDDKTTIMDPPKAADCIMIAHGARGITPNDDEIRLSHIDSSLSYETICYS
jgi:hypothetical protein